MFMEWPCTDFGPENAHSVLDRARVHSQTHPYAENTGLLSGLGLMAPVTLRSTNCRMVKVQKSNSVFTGKQSEKKGKHQIRIKAVTEMWVWRSDIAKCISLRKCS